MLSGARAWYSVWCTSDVMLRNVMCVPVSVTDRCVKSDRVWTAAETCYDCFAHTMSFVQNIQFLAWPCGNNTFLANNNPKAAKYCCFCIYTLTSSHSIFFLPELVWLFFFLFLFCSTYINRNNPTVKIISHQRIICARECASCIS